VLKQLDDDLKNVDFFAYINKVGVKDKVKAWQVFLDLPTSKSWVRTQVPILEKW